MTTKKESQRVRTLIQNAKRGERAVSLNLRGDIQMQIETLELELIKVREEGELKSLGGNPEAKRIAEQITALIEEAKDATIEVMFRALPRRQWADLVAKHPAENEGQLFDPTGLYNEAVPACWVTPEIDDETREKLLDEITQGQWDQIVDTVAYLNRGEQRVPFSALASRVLQNSDATSESPAPSE